MLVVKKKEEKSLARAVKVEEFFEEEEAASADIFGTNSDGVINGIKTEDDVVVKDEDSNQSLAFVKPEFLAEEEKVRDENVKIDKKLSKEDEDPAELRELSVEERYVKLMDLLNKSKFYSQFLQDKMTTEDEQTLKLKADKLAERKSLQIKNGKKPSAAPASKKRGRVSAKRAREEEDEAVIPDESNKSGRMYKGEPIAEEQPLLLTGAIMRDYQLKGYEWMATLYENGINGILADEMGLGKTIQTIALFCHLIEMGVPGPFIVVAPLSTISNWVKEFRNFAPEMPVVLYHGSQNEREVIRRRLKEVKKLTCFTTPRTAMNVFVTSYEIAMNDRSFFRHVKWRYLVVDEGHRLKNMHCRLIRELKQYQASNRLLLTGTPLQNNLDELWSLLNFLMGEIFDDLRVFKSWFSAKDIDASSENEQERIVQQEKQGNILNTLHQILTPFLLRRVKADVDLKIPPKKEVLVYCPMTTKQHEMYEAIVNKTIRELLDKDEKIDRENIAPNTKATVGRPSRNVARVDYKSILDLEEKESDANFDKYLQMVSQIQQDKDVSDARMTSAYNREMDTYSRTNALNFCLRNRMMDMRKVTNHPYLVEYPLSEDGVFYRVDEDLVEICGKIKVLDQMLNALLERKHKVLIFSQMTRMLDIIQDFCNLREFKTSRLDGSMGYVDRQANIDAFNEDEDVRIFLLSTRAGGLGINLTSADTCIIYDSDWNPQQDLQAQDRCHRIGQTKPVMVYRLVTANTIDEKIVERAAAKRKLEKMIIHSKKFKSQDKEGLKKTMEAISPQELLELLNSKDHLGVVDRKDGPVFKPEELDLLLDRSDLTWKAQKKMMDDRDKEEGSRKKKAKMSVAASKDNVVKNKNSIFKVIDTEGLDANQLPSVRET